MPFASINNVQLHYQIDGDSKAPWLVLSNSLSTNLDMWLPQLPALCERFHVLRYDTRGHGQSSVPAGPYTIAQLGSDVIGLMDHVGIDRAHFCGLSMGGMTGMWLASHHAKRIDRLALCNTAALIAPAELWNTRIDKVNQEGMQAIVPSVLDRWFTLEFLATAPRQVALVGAMLQSTPAAGYTACCAAIRDMDQRDALPTIEARTLVIAGARDRSTPPADGRFIAKQIRGAQYVELRAAHLSNWEVAEQFSSHLQAFLADASAARG